MQKCVTEHITVIGESIKKSQGVIYLGKWLEEVFSFKHHIGVNCRTTIWTLNRIIFVRHHLDQDTCELFICSFVLTHPEYSNGLLYSKADLVVGKLQKV